MMFGAVSGSAVFTKTTDRSWDDPEIVRVVGVHGYGGCPNKAVRITNEVLNQILAWADGQ